MLSTDYTGVYIGVTWGSNTCLVYMQVSVKPELADDPCKDPKYQEPAIDTMRAQKDEVELQWSPISAFMLQCFVFFCRSIHVLIILIVLRNHLVLPWSYPPTWLGVGALSSWVWEESPWSGQTKRTKSCKNSPKTIVCGFINNVHNWACNNNSTLTLQVSK